MPIMAGVEFIDENGGGGRGEAEEMSNRGWIIASLLMLACGAYFIVDHLPRNQPGISPSRNQTESPDGDKT
jgi:hypothetical protein